jgi:hypothetical protein
MARAPCLQSQGERERKRERERVCVCVYVCAHLIQEKHTPETSKAYRLTLHDEIVAGRALNRLDRARVLNALAVAVGVLHREPRAHVCVCFQSLKNNTIPSPRKHTRKSTPAHCRISSFTCRPRSLAIESAM